MRREKEDCWIVVKDSLCPVAMMNIPIDNGYLLNLRIMVLCITSSDGDIIKKTKPHRPFRCCVMTGRTNRDESVIDLSRHDEIDCLAWCAGRISGRIQRMH